VLNQVAIIGNLATAPRQEVLPSGTAKTSFLLAFNEFYVAHNGEQIERALFFWVECYGRQAVNAHSYLLQGQKVAISGALAGGNIHTKDGSYKNCTVIRATNIEYLQKPTNENNGTRAVADTLAGDDIPF
jgi:single stranded DNA-binding protein